MLLNSSGFESKTDVNATTKPILIQNSTDNSKLIDHQVETIPIANTTSDHDKNKNLLCEQLCSELDLAPEILNQVLKLLATSAPNAMKAKTLFQSQLSSSSTTTPGGVQFKDGTDPHGPARMRTE